MAIKSCIFRPDGLDPLFCSNFSLQQHKQNIGIFGGSFDPIHLGHIQCAKVSSVALNLDKVIFVPAGVPNFKVDKKLAPKHDRLEMCNLATSDYQNFEVSSIEIDRPGVSYMYQTIEEFKRLYPEANLYLLCSSDIMRNFDKWRNYESILNNARLVVVDRVGFVPNDEQKAAFKKTCRGNVEFLHNDKAKMSSSELRYMLAQGKDVSSLMDPRVIKYIKENNLYS